MHFKLTTILSNPLHCVLRSTSERALRKEKEAGSQLIWRGVLRMICFFVKLFSSGFLYCSNLFGILSLKLECLQSLKINPQKWNEDWSNWEEKTHFASIVKSFIGGRRRKKKKCNNSNVTRFGKISPLWQKFTRSRASFNGLFLIWQNAEPTLANLGHYWANFHCCKWPNLEK